MLNEYPYKGLQGIRGISCMLSALILLFSMMESPPTFARQTQMGIATAQLFVEPDDGVRVVTRAILQARHSILLEMYLLTDHTILHDLEDVFARGVDVHILLEQHPYGSTGDSPTINQSAYNALYAANIPVRWSSPAFSLTHEKAMVIDGQSLYIMTTNFSRAAFTSNREFGLVDQSSTDVTAISQIFWADWNRTPIQPHDDNLPISPSTSRALLTSFIGSSQHNLDIYAEEFQDPQMATLLERTARRGVHVRIILPAPASSHDSNAPLVQQAETAGIQVVLMPQSNLYIHAKAIVVDNQSAFVGSENFSAPSLDQNREAGLFVSNAAVVARLETTFNHDWNGQLTSASGKQTSGKHTTTKHRRATHRRKRTTQ